MNFIDEILRESELAEEQRRLELDKLRADQLLMAIAELEQQLDEVENLFQAELSLLQEYRDAETSRLNRKTNWLSWNLEQFTRELSTKTLTLPHGVLRLRKVRDKVEVVDLEAFMNADGHQRFIRVIPESFHPDLQAILDHIKSTGELPQGINLVPGDAKFSYTTVRRNSNEPQRKQHSTEAGAEAERVGSGEATEG